MSTAVLTRAPRRRASGISISRHAMRAFALAALLIAWELTSRYIVGGDSLPGPIATGNALGGLLVTGELWAAVGQTLQGTTFGLCVAAAFALPLGLLIGSSRIAAESSRITGDFLGSIPPISFIPLALLLFGSTLPMKLTIIVYGAFWPLLVRTIDAHRDINATQHDVADAFKLPLKIRWLRVYLPASLPGILVGLRVSLNLALLLSVGAEYVGGAPGVGGELLLAQVDGRSDDVQAYAFTAALIGVLLNLAMRLLEKVLIAWHPSVRSKGRP